MEKYKSDYTASYYKDKRAGVHYDKGISNRFELLLFELEKRVLFKQVEEIEKVLPSISYLDFACGTGRIIALFDGDFDKALGVDTNPTQLEVARQKAAHASFIEGNIVTDPGLIADGSVNLITSFRLMLNLEPDNRGVILRELHRTLSDGGYLIVDNHMNRYSFLGLIALFMRKVLRYPDKSNLQPGQKGIINTMTERQMRRLLKMSGFELLQVARCGILPGHKSFCLLPEKLLIPVESFLSRIPVVNLLSKNQIFLCKKKNDQT